MRNFLLFIFFGLLCASFTIIPAFSKIKQAHAGAGSHKDFSAHDAVYTGDGTILYHAINLEGYGLSKEAFDYAWKGYKYLIDQKQVSRTKYLTICDFSKSSKQKRLYIIDVEKQTLVTHTFVAHGRNSGGEFAKQFSNIPESLQSSLGFYITSSTYIGKHGLSLRLVGVEPGFNDNAFTRSIVIHGASYVDANRVKKGIYMGRSWGCPAVPQHESDSIIHTIKNGTCLFIYHPSKDYLQHSKILNA